MTLIFDPDTGLFWEQPRTVVIWSMDHLRILQADYEALGATALRLVPANTYRAEGLARLVQSWEYLLCAVRLAERSR